MKTITQSILKGIIKEYVEEFFDDPSFSGEVIQDVFNEDYRQEISTNYSTIQYQGNENTIEEFLCKFNNITRIELYEDEESNFIFECTYATLPTLEFKIKLTAESYYPLRTYFELWEDVLGLNRNDLLNITGFKI